MSDPVAIILAAGKGTRMKSEFRRSCTSACGRPMVEHVLDAARSAGVKRLVVVVGYKADVVREGLGLSSRRRIRRAVRAKGNRARRADVCRTTCQSRRSCARAGGRHSAVARRIACRLCCRNCATNGAACVIGTAITETISVLGRVVRSRRASSCESLRQKRHDSRRGGDPRDQHRPATPSTALAVSRHSLKFDRTTARASTT